MVSVANLTLISDQSSFTPEGNPSPFIRVGARKAGRKGGKKGGRGKERRRERKVLIHLYHIKTIVINFYEFVDAKITSFSYYYSWSECLKSENEKVVKKKSYIHVISMLNATKFMIIKCLFENLIEMCYSTKNLEVFIVNIIVLYSQLR